MMCSGKLIIGFMCFLAVIQVLSQETVTNGTTHAGVVSILGYPKASMKSRTKELLMYEHGVITLMRGKVTDVSLFSPSEMERRKEIQQACTAQQSTPLSIASTTEPGPYGIRDRNALSHPEKLANVLPSRGVQQPTSTLGNVTEDGLGGYRIRDSEGNITRVRPDYAGGYRATDEDGNVTRIRPDYAGGYRATDEEGNTTRIKSDAIGSASSLRSEGSTAFHSDGSTSTKIGNAVFHSDGSTSTKIGNAVFHSDGSTSTKIGNAVFHSSGETSTKIGNTVFHSNGETSTKIGNTIFNSDGSTSTRIGNTIFTSDGSALDN